MSEPVAQSDVRRGRSHLAGVLRVGLLGLLLVAAALVLLRQRVHAYGEAELERFGDHMMRYAGANQQNAPNELRVNGASFFISSGNVDASVKQVLDNFHAKCQDHNGRLQEQWADLAKKRQLKLGRFETGLLDGVFRSGGETSGVIVCAETGEGQLPPQQLMSRIQDVMRTGDLSKLGNLRYAYVVKSDGRTTFVALWSEGALNFRRMFPPRSDAPGNDPPGIPRPAGTRRLISAYPVENKASLNLYQSDAQSQDELIDFYWRELPRAGFELATKKHAYLSAWDGTRMITISIQRDGRTGHGIATVATQLD